MKVLFLLLMVSFVLVSCSEQTEENPQTMETISDYKNWHLVTPEHLNDIPPCSPGFVDEKQAMHEGSLNTIYANSIGRDEYLKTGNNSFLPGTILVKEKKEEGPETTIELAIMHKGEPGHYPEANDWTFYYQNADGTLISDKQTLNHCYDCHSGKKNQDFVFKYGN